MSVTSFARMIVVITVISLAILPLAASVHSQGPNGANLAVLDRTPHVPQQVLVQFRYGAAEEFKHGIRQRVQAALEDVVVAQEARTDFQGDLELWNLPPGFGIARAVRELQQEAGIDFVEPNWIYQHQATSNDPYYTRGSLWGMYGDGTSPANLYGSQAGEAWSTKTDCSGIYVGVIDEGMMYAHEDLAGNVWTNPYDSVDGVDNDGNGYIDDIRGWDFAGNDNTTFDGSADDHGTHVSGTIAAVGGNSKGVAGVCWSGIKLISAKFLGRYGGSTANAIKAVDYLTDLKTRHGLKIVATSNSWGGGGYSKALYDAIERANAQNILFVAAAGNSGVNIDVSPSYPASYGNSNIISVAAIDSAGNLASWSNYGATSVDIGAPGVGIWSSVPTKSGASAYSSYSGTSMATPHVTGAVALYAAAHPTSTAADIKSAILSGGIQTGSLTNKTVTGRRLNLCSGSCP